MAFVSSTFIFFTSGLLHAAHGSRSALGSYEAFRREHGRATLQENDAVSYDVRQDLFHRRKAEALAHNARDASWKMAVNRYSDFTDEELRSMLGYKRVGPRWGGQSSLASTSSLIQAHDFEVDFDVKDLASEVDWRSRLNTSASFLRNQGGCGSCWAVASIGAIEMHAERAFGVAKKLSHQQLVDCVPNPQHCGGSGGCQGATGELAFEYSQQNGLTTEDAYAGKGGKCSVGAANPNPIVSRFVKLPENQVKPLYHALATKGPVVVSLDGGNWFGYSSGVFSGCAKDTVVNHAVLAVGYGKDTGKSNKDYWTIRNSWGKDWGENGHMRIERHMTDDYCGVDNDPQAGVFCEGGPKSVTVCGMCGITSDSAFPVMARDSKVSEAAVENLQKASDKAPKSLRHGRLVQPKKDSFLRAVGAAVNAL